MLNIRKVSTGEKSAVLNLEGEVTIEYAEPLRKALLEGLREFDPLMVNCDQTSAIDFFAVQILCSAHRSSMSRGKLFTWQSPPPELIRNAIESLGFTRSHGCDLCPDGVRCLWV